MAGSYYIGVATAGDNAIAGPVVAAAVVFDAQKQAPVFQWSDARRSRSYTLDDFDSLPAKRRPQVSNWLRRASDGASVVVATVNDLNTEGLHACRALICGRALCRAVEHAVARDPTFRLTPAGTQVLVAGSGPISTAYAGKAEQRFFGPLRRYPWHLQAAYALARAHRDLLMREAAAAHPAFDFALNYGYPTEAHNLAILAKGPTPLHRNTSRLVRDLASIE